MFRFVPLTFSSKTTFSQLVIHFACLAVVEWLFWGRRVVGVKSHCLRRSIGQEDFDQAKVNSPREEKPFQFFASEKME